MKPYQIAVLLTVIHTVTGCDPSAPSADIVATVGDQVLTAAEFTKAAQRRQISNNDDAKRALLDELVEDMRLLQYARDNAFNKDPEFQREMNKWLISRARSAITDTDTPTVTEAELQATYNARQQEFTTPDRFHLAMIYVSKSTKDAAKKAEEIRQQAAAGTPFSELAATHSEDRATRYRSGDLGFVTSDTLHPTWGMEANAAIERLSMEESLSEVIEAEDGYRLFRLIERLSGRTRPFAEVRPQLVSELTRQKRARQRSDALSVATQNIAVTRTPQSLPLVPALKDMSDQIPVIPGD